MLLENEVVMLLLGFAILFFIVSNTKQIRRIYAWNILVFSYLCMLTGWILTILEGFFLEFYLNILEHVSYTLSAGILAFWCWKFMNNSKVEDKS